MLGKLFGKSPATTSPEKAHVNSSSAPAVLNVGGNSKLIAIPPHFGGWRHDLLDIDPAGKPDLLCDARELDTLPGAQYDAIYCSHNLEHYLHHDARRVLKGFLSILKEHGFADIRVPDIGQVIRHCAANNTDLDDVLYESPAGPIMVRDVRAWHGGTPNVSDRMRAIPNLEFYAPWFHEPMVPGIDFADHKRLSPRAQYLSRFCVADSGARLVTGATLRAP